MTTTAPAAVTLRALGDDSAAAPSDAAALDAIAREVLAERLPGVPHELLDVLVPQQLAARAAGWGAQHPDATWLVIEHEGIVAGGILLDASTDPVHIVAIEIARASRGQGLATSALRALQHEHPALALSVFAHDEAAQRLYDRLGFVVTATHAAYQTREWRR